MKIDNLFFLRESKDMSQCEMAQVLGVNQGNISKWENGTQIIPLKKLNIYANFFNVSFDYIMGLSDVKSYRKMQSEIDSKEIGKRLKKFRKDFNLTQALLAKELNTTHSTISAYESGKTMILTSFVYYICKKYGISMDYLCGKIDN